MADNAVKQRFLDTKAARVSALVLALFLAVGLGFYVRDVTESETLPVFDSQTVNQSLQDCLEQRVGDVDRMKSEGILSDSQYVLFRLRAEELCRQQNPNN